jgi:hypothetical protein
MSWYSLAADAIVVFHAAYVGFVVFGMIIILIGILCHWRWIGNFWFRAVHLAMISVVVYENLTGIECPLTTWEDQLRAKAGQIVEPGTFIGRFCNHVLFCDGDPWVFTASYCSFATLVVLTLLLAPPRRPQWPRWLARLAEEGPGEGWEERLRLGVWLSSPELAWLARFLSGVPRPHRIQHRQFPSQSTPLE